jgi:hypothetical protein
VLPPTFEHARAAVGNFDRSVPGRNNAVPAAGSGPIFNGDPWQLRSTTEPEGAIKLEMQISGPESRACTVCEVG